MTGEPLGHPVRCIANKLTKEFLRLEYEHAPLSEMEKLGTGRLRAAVVDGDVVMGSVMSGQSAALVHDIRPCADIIRSMVSEAEEILKNLGAQA